MKKLTPSKILSSMALATLLVAAAGTPSAKAAGFDHPASNGNQVGGVVSTDYLEGDIQINGTFTKTASNLPLPTQAGKFLIVTMPISLDYSYDADKGQFQGAQGVIMNKSVEVTGSNPNFQYDFKPVDMTVVSLTADSNSSTEKNVMFVDTPNVNEPTKIQMPLQVTFTSSNNTYDHKFSELINANPVASVVRIEKDSNASVEIGLIPGRKVENEHLIQDGTSVAVHNLTLKFEYRG